MTSAAYVNGHYACYDVVQGRYRHYLGCKHGTPRESIQHTAPVYVSPKRSSAPDDGSTPGVPLHERALEPSSGVEGHRPAAWAEPE